MLTNTLEGVEDFLIDHNIVIRAIPAQSWILSREKQGGYSLTEEEGPRIHRKQPPRRYHAATIGGVLLYLLTDPRLKEIDRQAKYEEKYPIEEGSNVVRLGDLSEKRKKRST